MKRLYKNIIALAQRYFRAQSVLHLLSFLSVADKIHAQYQNTKRVHGKKLNYSEYLCPKNDTISISDKLKTWPVIPAGIELFLNGSVLNYFSLAEQNQLSPQ